MAGHLFAKNRASVDCCVNAPTAHFLVAPIARFLRRLSGARAAEEPVTQPDDARFALTCKLCGSYSLPADQVLVDVDRSLLTIKCPHCNRVDVMPISARIARAALAAGASLVVRDLDKKRN